MVMLKILILSCKMRKPLPLRWSPYKSQNCTVPLSKVAALLFPVASDINQGRLDWFELTTYSSNVPSTSKLIEHLGHAIGLQAWQCHKRAPFLGGEQQQPSIWSPFTISQKWKECLSTATKGQHLYSRAADTRQNVALIVWEKSDNFW